MHWLQRQGYWVFTALLILLSSEAGKCQSRKTNFLTLQGEDFPVQKESVLFCDTITSCWSIRDTVKRILCIQLNGLIDTRKAVLRIEVSTSRGQHKLRLDADGDPKYGELFMFEISGKNPPVDNMTYTLENESDEASVRIDNLDESTGQLDCSFTCRILNPATGLRKANISGTLSVNRSQ